MIQLKYSNGRFLISKTSAKKDHNDDVEQFKSTLPIFLDKYTQILEINRFSKR